MTETDPTMPAHLYWQRRGRGELPATVRFTAAMEPALPEEPDYRETERVGFCLPEEWNDPNVTHIQGYPKKSR